MTKKLMKGSEAIGEAAETAGEADVDPNSDINASAEYPTHDLWRGLALEAADLLTQVDIDLEVIDVQTLAPFDLGGRIRASLEKTNRIVFLDEDVPGGATAYMMQQVLVDQAGFDWLDAPPRTLSAKAHRPAYGSDGDYFSKPNREQIFTAVYDLMHQTDPARYPSMDT